MKKISIIVLTLSLIMCLASCGNKENRKNDNNLTILTTQSGVRTNPNSNDNTLIELSNSYKVPGKEIVVNVPNYQEIEKGFTQLYILHGEQYVAITAEKNTRVSNLDEAHEVAFNKFKDNIQNYSYVNSIKIKESKNRVINNIDTYRYEGILNCGHDTLYDAYVIGYSFIMDDVPCTIIGSVINQEQSQPQIDEIRDIIEAMINSLRSKR